MSAPTPHRPIASLLTSFGWAVEGFLHTIEQQRNMRLHVLSALLVGLVGSGLPFGLAERVTLLFCVLLVFFAEILNSALEALVDLYTEEVHERAKVAKDAAAGGVFVLAVGAVAVLGAVLVANLGLILAGGQQIVRQVAVGVPFVGIAALLIARFRRPRALDAGLALVGFGLLGAQSRWTTSVVFTSVNALLFLACVAVAVRRRRATRTPSSP